MLGRAALDAAAPGEEAGKRGNGGSGSSLPRAAAEPHARSFPSRDKGFSILRKNIRFEKLNLSLCRILPDFFRRLRPDPVFYRLKREIFRPETSEIKYFLIISAFYPIWACQLLVI